MPRPPRTKGKHRFGYDGCLTDLIVLGVIGLGVLWGIRHWNAMPRRPLGLPAVPLPRVSRFLPFVSARMPRKPPALPQSAPTPPAPPSSPRPVATSPPTPTAPPAV